MSHRGNTGRHRAFKRVRPTLEPLESRLTPSSGGWISSTQAGQSGVGIFGQYFDNTSMSGTPSFTRWDNLIDFSASGGDSYPGGASGPGFGAVGPGGWSAKWTGLLTTNLEEPYTFSINTSGDGVRLWVIPVGQQQGSPLINDWTEHGQVNDTATVTLQAGQDYAVEMDATQASSISQQLSLQWSSPTTPLEDIAPVTQVGLNVDGQDSLFANLVNGGTDYSWGVPTDSNDWPENNAQMLLAEGDTAQEAGGSYLVQFNGMATVSYNNGWGGADWLVNGVDLHSPILQAGQGYDPATNTTTATMVIPPNPFTDMYITFANTCRDPNSSSDITSISEVGTTVTVSLPSVAGIVPNQTATISGLASVSAGYNGSFLITGVNQQDNTFTFTDANPDLPSGLSGGSASFAGNGITDLYVMQPSTQGGSTPLPVGTLFTPATLGMAAQFTTLRFMGLEATNANLTSDWSDRTLVSDNFWSGRLFNSEAGVDTGVSSAPTLAGIPWEIQVALANETGKDIYINIPSNASIEYIDNLADLFAYGSDGVTPYTSVQADPIWKPLDSNLKVYIEFSNETWNFGFPQAETREDGWINQLSQRALYDYMTDDLNDPLYPGGGSNAYNDGAILSIDEAFDGPASYTTDPVAYGDGGSPVYFTGTDFGLGADWVGLRDVQISEAFKATFGEADIAASDPNSRVRPVYEWQGGANMAGGLAFIQAAYGAEHPVNYYLYGGGAQWYAGNGAEGFSDVLFADPAFSGGLYGWSSSGSAGVVSNESPMGNPDAPPAFSPIDVTGGASESGNLVTITTTSPHDFAPGESITVSTATLDGYDGTFTVESATPDSFTYFDPTSGLGDSGDDVVTVNASSSLAAYLQPGADISQEVTFSGGYADITLYACQTVPLDWYHGLSITLTPTDGGPAINGGQPINVSQGEPLFSGSQGAFAWDCSEAFYTGDKPYTYAVTFTSTLQSGTVFLADPAIQTVNGMFDETTAASISTYLNINGEVQLDAGLALEYGLSEVGYEGGYYFNGNLAVNGYAGLGAGGYSSAIPNVDMYASLDPRTEQLAVDSLDEFYSAGGTLPIMFESSFNANSWAIAAPYYFDWDTPKVQAAVSVEQAPQPATDGFTPGSLALSDTYGLTPGGQFNSTWLVPTGSYSITLWFEPGNETAVGQTDPVEVFINGQLVATEQVPVTTGGVFTIPVGSLSAGQYSVGLTNDAPVGNGNLGVGGGGVPVYSLIEVAQAAPTLDVAAAGGVYDGSPFLASASVAGVGGVPGASLEGVAPVLTYYAGGTTAGTPLVGPPTAAGTYTVMATFPGSADYAPATTQATFTIGRATPTVLIANTSRVYDDGSPLSVPALMAGASGVAGASLEGVAPVLTYYAGGAAAGTPLAGPPTGVGTYTVTAAFPGSADYDPATMQATFTITIGRVTPTVLVADTGLVYDGSPLPVSASVMGASGIPGASLEGVAPILTYYAGGAAAGTPLAGPPTAAGTYTVTVAFPGSVDYTPATTQATFTISLATPTVVVADAGGVYHGSSFPASASVAGASGTSGASLEGVAPVLTYYAGGAAAGTPLAGPPTAAGTYTVTVAFPGSVDYTPATTQATFTISLATPTVVVADAGGVYDGSPFHASTSVAGDSGVPGASLEGVAPVLTYYAGGTAAGTPLAGPPTAVGTYTVTAVFPGSVNYAPATTTQATFTIGRATPTIGDYGFEEVSVGAGNFVYGPTGSPWTFSGGAGLAGNGSNFTSGNPSAPQGSQVAFLQNTGSITQSMAGWTAGSYTLSFDAAQRGNGGGVNNFEVLVDGIVVGTFEPTTTTYQTYTTNVFTVTAGTHAIEFLGINSAGGDDTDFLDNLNLAFTSTVVVADAGGVYDGSPFPASASVAGVSGVAGASLEGVAPVLTYYAGGTAAGTPLAGSPTAAGTYTVTAAFPGSVDYDPATTQATFTITIGLATPSVLVADAGGVYHGSSFPASASVAGASGTSGASLEGVALVLTYYAGGTAAGTPLAGPPTAVGTYTVTAAFPGSADYAPATTRATFTIGLATPMVVVADAGGVYHGSSFPASASVAGASGTSGASLEGVAPVLTYYAGGTAAGTPLSGPPTAVGTYTVTAIFPGSADYAPATTQATFTIGRATPTVVVADAGGVYHGSSFPASASVAGVGGVPGASLEGVAPVLTYYAGGAAAGTPLAGSPTAAGTYTVTAAFPGSADYAPATTTQATFTIGRATPTVAVADAGGVYHGAPFPASASVAGASGVPGASLEGIAPVLTYYTGGTAAGTPLAGPPTAAGTYTVTAAFPGSADYAPATAQATFTIGRATPTVVVADAGGVYHGSPFPASASVMGASGVAGASLEGVAPVLTYYAGGTAAGTPLAGPPTAVGTYTVTAAFPGSADYAPATTQATFTIGRATPTVVVADAGGVYHGSSFPASASVAGASGASGASLEGIAPVLTYYAGGTAAGTPLAGPPTAAGTYTVTAAFPGSADYAPATAQATFTIGRVLVADADGTSQSALVNGIFATLLQAAVVDQYGNPVSGVTVTFAAPASGASGSFVGSKTVTATTNALGVATAPAFTANTSAGVYTVSATVSGLSPVTYSLTNTEMTSTTLTVQSSSVPFTHPETFTATVAAVAPAVSKPIGSVSFYDGSNLLGSAMINNSGQAVFTISTLAPGPHSITASYTGNPGDLTSGSTKGSIRVGDAVAGDYDGDGKSDIAIFDQTTSTFYIEYSGGGTRVQPLGNPADKNIPVTGDFNGDGKDDLAIYDQTLAEFFILYSGGGSLALPFGNPAHVNIPVAGDFFGDGKTDIAIYDQTAAIFYVLDPGVGPADGKTDIAISNQSAGIFYALDSGVGTIVKQLGNANHVNIPVAGDFDGDGKTDFAIFDQTAATFYVLESGGGSSVKQIGNPSHVNVPIATDFSGDGKTDLTIYDQTAGVLYSLESGGGTIAQPFGNPADVNIPVAGDYAGDGQTDIGIYDATDSEFFIIYSDGGSLVLQFGNNKHNNLQV